MEWIVAVVLGSIGVALVIAGVNNNGLGVFHILTAGGGNTVTGGLTGGINPHAGSLDPLIPNTPAPRGGGRTIPQ